MTVVAGVDFGTLSVRVSIVDSQAGLLASAAAEYPLHRRRDDPDFATQSHADHMRALGEATRGAVRRAGIPGERIAAIALDTTGSSVVPVEAGMVPLDDYYLWCDHHAKGEAAEITALARAEKLAAIDWCGGVYSAEWGWAKLLHWLRHNPAKRDRFVSAFEHCDMVAATLAGVTDPALARRSVCAAGHKWLWHPDLGGLPPEKFLVKLDPLLAGVRARMDGAYLTSDHVAGSLSPGWAAELGLKAGIPIPVGAFDAHWDALGAGARRGDVVNVVGTSTCIIAFADHAKLVPGVCGVVRGSVHPRFTGIEAGLSAVGDVFNAIATRAGSSVAELGRGLDLYRAGQTGMLRLPWDNGDRTVLVNADVAGMTIGWRLNHTAADELFAAIEGTAFHTRVVLERLAEYDTPTERVINGGGVPQNNPVLNQIYADVLGCPVLVPETSVTGIGSAIFAFLAAGAFATVEEAQAHICPRHTVFMPRPENRKTYDALFGLFRRLYFDFGSPKPGGAFGDVLPALMRTAREAVSG